MIHPTCLEMLATVQSAITREIVPRLKDVEGRSTAATIEHLLRHIALRIEHEGRILSTDIARLRELLEAAAAWMDGAALDISTLRAVLATYAQSAVNGNYRNLDQLGEAALALRGALVTVQGLLEGRDDEAAMALHQRIRDYIGLQLADEAQLIEPAFVGQGPRR